MRYDFDKVIDRRNSDSTKWNYYPADVLPLWTADMDFGVAEPIIEALHRRVGHGVFGYTRESAELREVVAERMRLLYGWTISPEQVLFQSGVVLGFNRVCRVAAGAGDEIIVQPPVYPPILAAPGQNGMVRRDAPLARGSDGRYTIDFDALESIISERTRVLILCNPHNPVGRAFTREELRAVAGICVRRNVLICSDEIHCDILFRGTKHVPIGSLDPEIAKRTVTLIAPSKTYNIPGLHCSMAIVPDPDLRRRMQTAEPYFPEVNTLGFTAALAAYTKGGDWLAQVLDYLEQNRDVVANFVERELPGFSVCKPEASYLAWVRCPDRIPYDPGGFFLEKAKVAFSGGRSFGVGGERFVRINFACPRSILLEALRRMKSSVSSL